MVRFLVSLLLVCMSVSVRAEDAAKLRKFADSLFHAEDYFRAQTEYRRLLSYYPSTQDAEEIEFKSAQCSFKAGRFAEAASALGLLAERTSSKMLMDKCRITSAASLYRLGEYRKAGEECALALERNPRSELRDRFLYLSGLTSIRSAEWKEAGRAFDSVPAESALSDSAQKLSSLAGRAEKMKPRSPFLNGLASAVVPGAGQTACGFYADGVAAMAVTSACLASAIIAQERGNQSLAAAGYAFFGIFHSANIYGGAAAARRANRRAFEGTISQAENLRALSLE